MKLLQEIKVPQESVNDNTLIVVDLCFSNGDFVSKNQIVLELESSKAIIAIEADCDGYIKYDCSIGEDVLVNQTIAKLFDSYDNSDSSLIVKEESNLNLIPDSIKLIHNLDSVFSDSALSLIESYGLLKSDFSGIPFVDVKCVETFINVSSGNNSIESVKGEPKNIAVPLKTNLSSTQLKISSQKLVEIEYLSSIQQSSLTSTLEVDIEMGGFFYSVNPNLELLKDSILPILTFEVSKLLNKFQLLNSYFNNSVIELYEDINIGIAMDMLDHGLKVAKISNTDKLSIKEIETEIFSLANKYLERSLKVEELTDVTFTITDLSGSNISSFKPLVNFKNSAILGISSIDKLLNRLKLILTFDHRVTEGKYVSEFLDELKMRLESYSYLKDNSSNSKLFCYKCSKKLSDDLNGLGFVRVVNSLGQEKLICETCLFS